MKAPDVVYIAYSERLGVLQDVSAEYSGFHDIAYARVRDLTEDEDRAEFEEWFAGTALVFTVRIDRKPDGQYLQPAKDMWLAWRASRRLFAKIQGGGV